MEINVNLEKLPDCKKCIGDMGSRGKLVPVGREDVSWKCTNPECNFIVSVTRV